jgi:hypothetical protein
VETVIFLEAFGSGAMIQEEKTENDLIMTCSLFLLNINRFFSRASSAEKKSVLIELCNRLILEHIT